MRVKTTEAVVYELTDFEVYAYLEESQYVIHCILLSKLLWLPTQPP